jgi:hypothetical protein
VDAADEQRAAAVFDRVLGSIASDSWQTSRARRLARAFAGLVRERQS